MLGKRSRPMIGKITELLVSGNRAMFFDAATSPKSPSELKIQSPRGVKNYDLGGGVGLGIVVALDKSGGVGTEFLAKYAMTSPKSTRTDPIPVNSVKNCNKVRGYYEEQEMDRFENCSYLKSSSSSSSSSQCHDRSRTVVDKSKSGFDRKIKKNTGIFTVSPAICPEDTHSTTSKAFPMTDFLSSCHACRKNLHGKDIYMYRGEKAFCSTECRARQIRIDERKEQCRSEATRSVDVSNSPYAQGNIFSTGILAV